MAGWKTPGADNPVTVVALLLSAGPVTRRKARSAARRLALGSAASVGDTPRHLPSWGRHDASPLRCRAGLPDGGLMLVQDPRRVIGDLG
jgi:hypothetical protein